eukprot:g22228.t1
MRMFFTANCQHAQNAWEEPLVQILAMSPIPVTYAGGVRSLEDMERIRTLGAGRVDATIGSALDIFGGKLPYQEVVKWHYAEQKTATEPDQLHTSRTFAVYVSVPYASRVQLPPKLSDV